MNDKGIDAEVKRYDERARRLPAESTRPFRPSARRWPALRVVSGEAPLPGAHWHQNHSWSPWHAFWTVEGTLHGRWLPYKTGLAVRRNTEPVGEVVLVESHQQTRLSSKKAAEEALAQWRALPVVDERFVRRVGAGGSFR